LSIEILQNAVKQYGNDLEQYKQLGNIKVNYITEFDNGLDRDVTYYQFNYTNKAAYEKKWNSVERISRGLIIRDDGKVIARPFDKFFNLNEVPETYLTNLPPLNNAVITTKLDGSMVYLYLRGTNIVFSTRGSFDNIQIEKATEYFKTYFKQYNRVQVGLLSEYISKYTFIFEILYGDEERIIQYIPEEHGLYLLGIRENETGRELTLSEMYQIANELNLTVISTEYKKWTCKEDILCFQSMTKGVEGLVLSWNKLDSVFRVKIKVNEYAELAQAINHCTPKHLLNVYLGCHTHHNGIEKLNELAERLPKYYQEIIYNTTSDVSIKLNNALGEITEVTEEWCSEYNENYGTNFTIEQILTNLRKEFFIDLKKYIRHYLQGDDKYWIPLYVAYLEKDDYKFRELIVKRCIE
jgi:hypothetical protein